MMIRTVKRYATERGAQKLAERVRAAMPNSVVHVDRVIQGYAVTVESVIHIESLQPLGVQWVSLPHGRECR